MKRQNHVLYYPPRYNQKTIINIKKRLYTSFDLDLVINPWITNKKSDSIPGHLGLAIRWKLYRIVLELSINWEARWKNHEVWP